MWHRCSDVPAHMLSRTCRTLFDPSLFDPHEQKPQYESNFTKLSWERYAGNDVFILWENQTANAQSKIGDPIEEQPHPQNSR